MTDTKPIYHNIVQDSRRWDAFEHRPGDIVITTPAKCGTTWMQRICGLLIFQTSELDRPLTEISPWLDMLTVDLEGRFWQWVDHPALPTQTGSSLRSTMQHIEVSLAESERPNVHVFHYAEMKADLEGEMRRLANLVGIEVPEDRWADLVEAATFENMKSHADETAPAIDVGIWKENRDFFHSGRGGGWRGFFDDAAHARYNARVGELSTPEVAAWAHR